MAQLAYYASRIPGKETWFETPEGYRIYRNTPVARTGSQEYFGRELKKNAGYDPAWDLRDDEKYQVFRPLEEVTAPETIASFEIKSVLDEHPSGDRVLVDALDELEGVSKGHAQNIRVGPPLTEGEFAGETPLLADLVVKHPELNVKIESGVQEVSCGYTFLLAKDALGRLIMTKIRGNHVAVVPRGRAGPEIAIGDAAPAVSPTTTTEERKAPMSFSSVWRTLKAKAFQDWAKDAKPEEVADAMEELEKEKAADKKGAKDGHAKDCGCKDCKAAADAKAAKDAEEEKERKEKEAADAKAAKDAEEEKERKEKEEQEKAAKDEAEILAPEDRGRSEFSVGDALAGLEALRPVLARSRDKGAIDAYNGLAENLRKVRDGVKAGSIEDPFVSLVNIGIGDADVEPERPMLSFFSGKTWEQGNKDWNEYLASRAGKGAK